MTEQELDKIVLRWFMLGISLIAVIAGCQVSTLILNLYYLLKN